MRKAQTAIKIQIRVVHALMLRETKTLFGKHTLGYLWVFINAAFHIGIFWGIRGLMGLTPPHGMSTPVFLLGGFIPFYLFSESITGGMNAIAGNRALLAYPQVFPLDLLLARTLLQGAVYICVMTFFLSLAVILGYRVPLGNPYYVLLALFLSSLLGFGLGIVVSSMNLIWPTTAMIVPMVMRVLFFVSGLFFSVDNAPLLIKDYLFYNPLSHLIELERSGLASGIPSRFVFLPYVLGFTLTALAFGLLLERYSRRYLDEAA